MTKLTLRIQALLHPSDEKERDAMAIWQDWLGQGFTPRQLITDMILRCAGRTPEMYKEKSVFAGELRLLEERITGKIDDLQSAIENDIGSILKDLKRSDPEGLRRYVESDDMPERDVDFEPEFIENAKRSVRKTFKQRQQERDEDE